MMVMKKRKVKVSKPIGILKEGKRLRFAFGTKTNPRKGRKLFNSMKTLRAYAKKKGFIK